MTTPEITSLARVATRINPSRKKCAIDITIDIRSAFYYHLSLPVRGGHQGLLTELGLGRRRVFNLSYLPQALCRSLAVEMIYAVVRYYLTRF